MFQYNHWESEVQVPDDATAFVYKVTTYNASEGFKYYVGYKSMTTRANWKLYKTSSEYIKKIIKAGTHRVHFEIIEFFTCNQDAVQQERNVQLAYDVLHNSRWHNKSISSADHFTTVLRGEEAPNFKGYWVTPKGTFTSSKVAGDVNGFSCATIQRKCYCAHPGFMFVYATAELKANETTELAKRPKWHQRKEEANKRAEAKREDAAKRKQQRDTMLQHKREETKKKNDLRRAEKQEQKRIAAQVTYDGVVYANKEEFAAKVHLDHPTVSVNRMLRLARRNVPYDQWTTWVPPQCIPEGSTEEEIDRIRKRIFKL